MFKELQKPPASHRPENGLPRTDRAEGTCRKAAGGLYERMKRRLPARLIRRHGIGARLLFLIVLFSSVVTLVATSLQLYLDYQRDVDAIARRLDEVESSYLDSVRASLWNLDIQQLKLLLDGIQRLPDVQSVELRESESNLEQPLVLTTGVRPERAGITREYPLVYTDGNISRVIGTLRVDATLNEVYERLIDKAMVILASQGVKTFLVSLFILYIFHRLVTRHLSRISEFVSNVDPRKTLPVLRLQRSRRRRADELDQVVNAFNEMCVSLKQAYEELRTVNAELERDIIARRRAEQEVNHLNAVLEQRVYQRTAELEAANKELGSFCYSVSHDLRAPLRRVEGFRRLLIEHYSERLDKQGVHYLNRIEAGTREMADMIDSFLRLSRSTRGELSVQQFNLSRLVQKVVRRLVEKEPGRKVEMEIRPDVYVEGDRRLLELMMTNLLDNAWKYTRERDEPRVWFGFEEQGGRKVYYVRDNGAGFDMTYAARLFTPFARLHRVEEFDGIGIGLATVQRIIARHGGRIWAESEIDSGATFYFTLWEREEE